MIDNDNLMLIKHHDKSGISVCVIYFIIWMKLIELTIDYDG